MRKFTYITMLFVALATLSFSCTKDDEDNKPEEPTKTLQEQYPEWSNLYGEYRAFNGKLIASIKITIVGNEGMLEQLITELHPTLLCTTVGFRIIKIDGDKVTLIKDEDGTVRLTGTFTKVNGKITTLTTSGDKIEKYTYTYTMIYN